MKIILAGGEAWWERFRDHGIRYVLFSYHYLRTQKDFSAMIEWMEKAKREGYTDPKTGVTHPYFFMLDSGAFTFKVKGDPDNHLDEYAAEYIRFLQDDPAADLFDCVAELDVYMDILDSRGNAAVRGESRVKDWRDQLHAAVGRRLMTVATVEMGKKELEEICNDPRFDYLGVASSMAGDVYAQRKITSMGHSAGKWVHGFGMTRLQTDMKYLTNYDSVDSTTWLRADKYGGTFIVRKGSIVILDHKHKHLRKNYTSYFRNLGLDPKKILGLHKPHAPGCPGPDSQTKGCEACRDQLHELRSSSLLAWKNLTYHYERFDNKHKRKARMPPLLQGESDQDDHTDPSPVQHRATDRGTSPPGSEREPLQGDHHPSESGADEGGSSRAKWTPEAKPHRHRQSGRGGAHPDGRSAEQGTHPREPEGRALPPRPTPEGAGEDGQRARLHPHRDHPRSPRESRPKEWQQNMTSSGKPTKKGFKGAAKKDPRFADFGGYRCPHYRRRPGEVYSSLNCRACPNLPTCAALEEAAKPAPPQEPPQPQEPPPPSRAEEGSSNTTTPTTTQEPLPEPSPEPLPLPEPTPGNEPQAHPTSPAPVAHTSPQTPEKSRLLEGVIPEHHRLPVMAPGGLNLGALRQGLPRIECNTCAIAEDCPAYQPGSVCAFNELFDQFDTRNSDDLYALQQMLVEWDKERTFKFMLLERLTTGGVVDPKVTAQMDSLQRRIQLLHEMQVARTPNPRTGAPALHIHHHQPAPGGEAQAGILSQIFGGSDPRSTEPQEVIDAEAVPRDPPKEGTP